MGSQPDKTPILQIKKYTENASFVEHPVERWILGAVLIVSTAFASTFPVYLSAASSPWQRWLFNLLLMISAATCWRVIDSWFVSKLTSKARPNHDDRKELNYQEETLVLMRALEVFGDSENAERWMREANPALDNRTPVSALQTPDGRREVTNILGRIEHGVIS